MAGTDELASIARDLQTYVDFGSKQAGGTGDNACGQWLAKVLGDLGFAVEWQAVSTPCFTPARCMLTCGETSALLWPQPIVMPTGDQG
jgi:acetylornithine deacetylase/succinyl-diaminopimelate desuccinylase-like protein